MTTSMMPMPSCSPFEALPHVVLDLVCDYLADEERERSNLFAFSLTSKICCQIATKRHFERVRLSVWDPQRLEHIISECDDMLRVGERHRHVRKAKITGSMSLEGEGKNLATWVRSFGRQNDYTLGWDEANLEEGHEMTVLGPLLLAHYAGWDPTTILEKKAKRNELWRPLGAFLARLPGLKTIIWASIDQMPRCILDLLHNQFPSSNLHLNMLSLRAPCQEENVLHDIDDDVYALATSPCLSSISAASSDIDHESVLDFTEEAILQMVMGMAPNLHSVCMWYQQKSRVGPPPPRFSWRGFTAEDDRSDITGTSTSKLTNLTMQGETRILLEHLENWGHHIDFARLPSLSFNSHVDNFVLQTLIDLAKGRIFQALRSFSLHVGRYGSQLRLANPSERVMTAALLSAPNPLRSLHIKGKMDAAIMNPILRQHGTLLHRLHLPDVMFSYNEVVAVSKKCTNIESLQLGIQRNGGSKEEVQLYRSLGSMPRLTDLTLKLDFDSEDAYIDRHFSTENYRDKLAERVHPAMINRAIDADLAHSIFQTILSYNINIRSEGIMPTFHSLQIRTKDPMLANFEKSFENLREWICRSWMCQRRLSDANSLEAIVREIGKDKRLNPKEGFVTREGQQKPLYPDLDLFRPAWDTVWPEVKGRTDWINVWHSFPLWCEP